MKTQDTRASSSWKEAMLFYLGGFFLLLAAALAAYIIVTGRAGSPALPDDVEAARKLLAQKFTGPEYFQINDTEREFSPYISVPNAMNQVKGIVQKRQWPPDASERIERLIDKWAVPAEGRMAGGDRVNALQLNLALDEMR